MKGDKEMSTDSKTKVIIEEKAFMGILVAAVEAFPSKYRPNMCRKPNGVSPEGEVHGLLFGQRMNKGNDTIFNVTLAVANQIVYERDENGIAASTHHIECICNLIELFPTYQLLGFFHSHPYRRKEFHKKSSVLHSDDDSKSALAAAKDAGGDLLEVIVGITCLERLARTQPKFIENHLIHNCCGFYKFSLACYEAIVANNRLQNVGNLICPVASGMNYMDFGSDYKMRA